MCDTGGAELAITQGCRIASVLCALTCISGTFMTLISARSLLHFISRTSPWLMVEDMVSSWLWGYRTFGTWGFGDRVGAGH